MPTQTVTNLGISAITPDIFLPAVNMPLYKSLVSLAVADVNPVPVGNTLRIRRFSNMSAATYTPGTPLSANAQQWAYDTFVITTFKHATFYHDMVQNQMIDVDVVRNLAEDTAYQLKNKIDIHVFQNITGSDGFVSYNADAGSLQAGTAHRPVSATTASIISIFANAKKVLLQRNVEQTGDWCAVVTPAIAATIDIKAASSGFQVADMTLQNGYRGKFLGFEVYESNNLPSGKCSAIAPTISGGAVSATTCKSIYFGRKGMMRLWLNPPQLFVTQPSDKIGKNYITYATYGSGIPTNDRSRGLNVAVQSSYY